MKSGMAMKNEKQKENRLGWISDLLLFPVTFLYLEFIMLCAIRGSFGWRNLLYIALFSVIYGMLFYLICSLVPNRKVRCVLAGAFLLVFGVMDSVIYLLFCEFQIFYDINTMFSGAGDAIGDFSGDVISILFTGRGIFYVLLLFAPFLLWTVMKAVTRKGKGLFLMRKISWLKKGMVFTAAAVFYAVVMLLVYYDEPAKGIYHERYDYTLAIRRFGIATGIRLDVEHLGTARGETIAFETVEDIKPETEPSVLVVQVEEDMAAPEVVIPEGKNEMDIDFASLAEQVDDNRKALDEYVSSIEASSKNAYTGLFKGKNLIFLTAEAFTEEAIDAQRTPTLYRMATKGIQFTDYYQPASAGTTGGEYANIFGMYPTMGGKSMKETSEHLNWSTMGSRLDEEGYYGKAYHNNDYTFYDRDKTHNNLGYSDGYTGRGNGMEEYLSSCWPESDLEMIKATFPEYADKQPFNIYYMTVSGHSLYTYRENAMARKNWDAVSELSCSDPVKVYLGGQMELEAAMTYLVNELEARDMADDTVIVLCTDHFPYGLDQDAGNLKYLEELYGYPVTNSFERDHSRLIIWSGCLEDEDPIVVDTPTTSVDILPTLCNLFGVEFDSRLLPGRDVFSDAEPVAYTLGYEWKTPLGTYTSGTGFVPASDDVEIPEGYVKRINAIVKNKINYSRGVLQYDYFRHVFGG